MSPSANVIELLDPARHDRSTLTSGVAQVDNFLRQTAAKLARADNLQTFVMSDATGNLIGFYAINAHSIDYTMLPQRFARTRPEHGSIPAAYISMIGVDLRYQGRGHGSRLLLDALSRITEASQSLGIAVVLLDVLDCGDPTRVERRRALYLDFGFQSLPRQPLRLYLPMATVRRMLEASR